MDQSSTPLDTLPSDELFGVSPAAPRTRVRETRFLPWPEGPTGWAQLTCHGREFGHTLLLSHEESVHSPGSPLRPEWMSPVAGVGASIHTHLPSALVCLTVDRSPRSGVVDSKERWMCALELTLLAVRMLRTRQQPH